MGVTDDTYLTYEIEQSIIALTQRYVTKDVVCQYLGTYLFKTQFSPNICIKKGVFKISSETLKPI